MKAYMVYDLFFNFEKNNVTIGGIQTYICDLAMVLKEIGYEVIVIQKGNAFQETQWGVLHIIQLEVSNEGKKLKHYKKKLAAYVEDNLSQDDLLIFMTHTLNISTAHKKKISIQHGIYWDIPYDAPRASSLIELFFREFHAWNDLKLVNEVPTTVAVDYNFLNWYKTQQYFCYS